MMALSCGKVTKNEQEDPETSPACIQCLCCCCWQGSLPLPAGHAAWCLLQTIQQAPCAVNMPCPAGPRSISCACWLSRSRCPSSGRIQSLWSLLQGCLGQAHTPQTPSRCRAASSRMPHTCRPLKACARRASRQGSGRGLCGVFCQAGDQTLMPSLAAARTRLGSRFSSSRAPRSLTRM